MKNNILILGPKPSAKAAGVVTHIRNLLKYDIFNNAEIFDIGSLNASFESDKSTIIELLKRLFKLRKKCLLENNKVLINVSLYKSSLYKLLLQLIFIGKNAEKILVFFHGGRINSQHRLVLKLIKFITSYRCNVDCFYFLSNVQKCGFERYCSNVCTNIYNNYSSTNHLLKKKKSEKFKFLYVGRLEKKKGLFQIIDTINYLSSKCNEDFILEVVGDGSIKAELQEIVNKNGLNKWITFKGYLSGDDLKSSYQSSEWLLFPTSHPEGFPYVYIEAMQAGLPVISTPSGALSRLVRNGYNGFLIKENDNSDFIGKVEYVLKNKPNLTKNCYEEFTVNLSKRSAEKFYKNIINK